MGAAAAAGYRWFQAQGFADTSAQAGLQVAVLVPAAVVFYFGLCKVLRVTSMEDAAAAVRRKLRGADQAGGDEG
jgi:hypothetical protein